MLTVSNQFTMHTFILLENKEEFLGVTLPTGGRFSLYRRKSSELWLVHNPEPYVEVCIATCRMPVYTFVNELHYQ